MSKPTLRSFGHNVYSQRGEDGMLERLLLDIGVKYKKCGEFGAWDGLFLSNTARLWKDQRWESIQVEGDAGRAELLRKNVEGYDVVVKECLIYPNNVDKVFSLLGPLDVLSIDVDGMDYEIFEAMTITPRIIIIEYNQSVPPHLDIRQMQETGKPVRNFSASALAMKRLAESKGYQVAGRSETNLFLVHKSAGDPSHYYETEWEKLFSWDEYTYLIGDMVGNVTFVGRGPYWGYCTDPIEYPLRTEGEDQIWRKYPEFYGD